MNLDSRIYIAGHCGLVGSALMRRCQAEGYTNLITRTHAELDLTDPAQVKVFFESEKPEYVFLAAARVGGILANNTYPAEFIYSNLMIQTSVLHAAYLSGVKKLMFFGSSCAYPRNCPQPMKEEYLLAGYLEPTSEPYAIAKIAGIKMCEAYNRQYGTKFISVIPATLYGQNDDFDLQTSHVLSALIRKFHEAKLGMQQHEVSASASSAMLLKPQDHAKNSVVIWGTGSPRREFLYVDDLADACIFLMNLDESLLASVIQPPTSIINIGVGADIAIKELALLIRDVIGFQGELIFDSTKPDGAPQKLLDTSKMERLGWISKTSLEEGVRKTYQAYKESLGNS